MKTHLHPIAFLPGGSDTNSHVQFLSRALSSSCMDAFHFESSFATCQHLGIETLSNDAINAIWASDMLEYETN
jgi:hypothetical protein